jgi:hypothetical protein
LNFASNSKGIGARIMPRGGKRPGAGGPKGWDKERQRQKLREQFFARQDAMIDAQISQACGVKYLVARERKTGKFVEVTEEQVKAILSGKDDTLEMMEVWEKQPSVQAFADLANRALGKPAEHVEQTITGDLEIKWKG